MSNTMSEDKILQTQHSTLVTNLAKSGDLIQQELSPRDCAIIHMAMGISGEAGEVLDAIKKYVIYRKPVDMEHLIEELGDIEFYMEGLRQELAISREEVLEGNIAKLNKRYSGGSYSDDAAKERADKVEDTEEHF